MRITIIFTILLAVGVLGYAQKQSSAGNPPPIPANPDSLFGPSNGSSSTGSTSSGSGSTSSTSGGSASTSSPSTGSSSGQSSGSSQTSTNSTGGTTESPNSMFQGGMVESVPSTAAQKNTNPAAALLESKGMQIGGQLESSFTAYGTWGNNYPQLSDLGQGLTNEFYPTLQGTLYFDSRPDQNFRVFGKAIATYPFQIQATASQNATLGDLLSTTYLGLPVSTQTTPNIDLFELFSDFNYQNKVYFRVGKQVVNWGVGYFFSPADVISLTPIDPQNPTVEREGPIAVQTNVPFAGVDNFYLYLIYNQNFAPNTTFQVNDIAVAPKVEFVIGNYEIGLGGYYERNQRPKLMATATGSIGKVGVFGEAVLSQGTDRTLVESVSGGLLPYQTYTDSTTPYFSGTVGFNYIQTVWNVAIQGQYFYNGPGYGSASLEKAAYQVFAAQLLNNNQPVYPGPALSAQDIFEPGRNYGAAAATWSNIKDSNLSLAAFWEGNLTDGSGLVSPSVSYSPFKYATFTAATHIAYGADGTEFVQYGRMSFSLTASLGAGSF